MMAEDTELEGQISDQPEEQPTAENTEETQSEASPAPQVEDWESKARGYEAQLAREQERARYLEQTNRLLEMNTRQYAPRQEQEATLSPELAELDKTLDPLFSKRLKSQLDPLGSNIAGLMDGNDSLKFELYLMRKHPDLLEDEDALNRVYQQVEHIRQQAANVYGKYISRQDAFLVAEGIESSNAKSKARSQKKSTQVKEEAKRQLQVQAARSGEGQPERRVVGAAAVESALKKMRAGERTTPEERELVRKHLANVPGGF